MSAVEWSCSFPGSVRLGSGAPPEIPASLRYDNVREDIALVRLSQFDGGLGKPVAVYLKLERMDDWPDPPSGHSYRGWWYGQILFVTTAAPRKVRQAAAEGWGMDLAEVTDPHMVERMLIEYGATAIACDGSFPNRVYDAAVQEFLIQHAAITHLAGFWLDRAQNAVGATGWDFLRGDIHGARLRQAMSEGEE